MKWQKRATLFEMLEKDLDCIDSTNSYAKLHGSQFPRGEMVCITAEEQTSGRGQFGRRWISPRGVNLYVTFYFRLFHPNPHLSSLASLLSSSIQAVLEGEGIRPSLKWPNDLFLHGKKIGGVLCETEFHSQEVEVILGFGLNVNMEEKDCNNIDQPASSLRMETGRIWDKKELLQKIQLRWVQDFNKRFTLV